MKLQDDKGIWAIMTDGYAINVEAAEELVKAGGLLNGLILFVLTVLIPCPFGVAMG